MLFKATGFWQNIYDANDPVAVYLKGEFNKINNLNVAHIEQILDHSNRQKFRNPPAHTKYLPYSVARECKTFVENALGNIILKCD